MDTVLVEVHGNDGNSHRAAAATYIKNEIPGAVIHATRLSGERCKHGDIKIEVDYTKPEQQEKGSERVPALKAGDEIELLWTERPTVDRGVTVTAERLATVLGITVEELEQRIADELDGNDVGLAADAFRDESSVNNDVDTEYSDWSAGVTSGRRSGPRGPRKQKG